MKLRKLLVSLLIVFLVASFLGQSYVQVGYSSSPSLLYSLNTYSSGVQGIQRAYPTADGNYPAAVADNITVSWSLPVTILSFWIYGIWGSPTNNVTADIRTGATSTSLGTVVATSSTEINASTLKSQALADPTWYNFTFSATSLVNGNVYAFVLCDSGHGGVVTESDFCGVQRRGGSLGLAQKSSYWVLLNSMSVNIKVYGEDIVSPTYSGITTSSSGGVTTLSSLWTDDVNVSGYIVGTNKTGTFINQTWTSTWSNWVTTTSAWANHTLTVVSTTLAYEWWANDTANNWNNTGLLYFNCYSVTAYVYNSLHHPRRLWSTYTTTYANAWDGTSGVNMDTGTNQYAMDIGQTFISGDSKYRGSRSYARFNTAILPSRAVLVSAQLSLYGSYSALAGGNVTLRVQNWTMHDPGGDITTIDDWMKNGTTLYDDGLFSTTSWSNSTWNNITISNTAIININGSTFIIVRSSTDISKTAPSGAEWVRTDNTHPPILVMYYTCTNSAPTIGELTGVGQYVRPPWYRQFNFTINDADGVQDFFNSSLTFGTVTLKWTPNSTFVVYSGSGVTVGTCTFFNKNSTANVLSWNFTITNGTFAEGYVNLVSANVSDFFVTGTTSQTSWFYNHNILLYNAEVWIFGLRGKSSFNAETWIFEFRGKSFLNVEVWEFYLGLEEYLSIAQVALGILAVGLACFFGPIGILVYRNRKLSSRTCLALVAVAFVGIGLIVAFAEMSL